MAELIRWLTAANPRDRPSMREVLRSELLPPTVGDEQLTDLLRSLPDKCASNLLALHCSMLFHACFGCRSFAVRSLTLKKTGMSCSAEAYDRVVDAIFSMPVENLRPDEAPGTPNAFQVCFPHWRQPSHLLLSTAVLLLDSCNEVGWCPEVYVSGGTDWLQVSARQGVLEILESVFACHGAVPMDSTDIGFCPIDPPADIAALLSTTGARLAMRFSHPAILPALWLHTSQAPKIIQCEKRAQPSVC